MKCSLVTGLINAQEFLGIFKVPVAAAKLIAFGWTVLCFGIHSLRKGPLTMAGGCPLISLVDLSLCAGWTMGR